MQYSFALPSDSPSPLGGETAGARGAAFSNDGEVHYRYDRIGNMLAQTSTSDHEEDGLPVANLGQMSYGGIGGQTGRTGRSTSDPPGPHALTRIKNQKSKIKNRTYSYDASGNMTDIDELLCTWDFKDRLVAVENARMRTEYTYDYTDRRITKRVQAKSSSPPPGRSTEEETTAVLYPNAFFEVREHDAPVKYVWNGSTRVARVTGPLSERPLRQRIRLWSGWNLVAVALNGSLASLDHPDIRAVYRWDDRMTSSAPTTPSDSVGAGEVLWIQAVDSVTVAVMGVFATPVPRSVPPGDHFIGNAGLQPWKIGQDLPATSTVWAYELPRRQWFWRSDRGIPSNPAYPAVMRAGQAVFSRCPDPFALTVPEASLQVRYYHQDHLGSTAIMADAHGAVLEEVASYPFGYTRHRSQPGGLGEPYGFTQKERDSESALDYFESRYLLSHFGRFTRVDVLANGVQPEWQRSPQKLNLYTYCVNRPIVLTDPSGMDPPPSQPLEDQSKATARDPVMQEKHRALNRLGPPPSLNQEFSEAVVQKIVDHFLALAKINDPIADQNKLVRDALQGVISERDRQTGKGKDLNYAAADHYLDMRGRVGSYGPASVPVWAAAIDVYDFALKPSKKYLGERLFPGKKDNDSAPDPRVRQWARRGVADGARDWAAEEGKRMGIVPPKERRNEKSEGDP